MIHRRKLVHLANRRRVGVVVGLLGVAVLVQATVVLAGGSARSSAPAVSATAPPTALNGPHGVVYVGHSYKNDVSPVLRGIARAAAQGGPRARGRAQPAHRTSRERAGPRRPALARRGEHARAEPQLRRDPVPRRRLQLRAAGHERRSRRHAVRPDRERGLPGVLEVDRRVRLRPRRDHHALERLRRRLPEQRRRRPGRALRPAGRPLGDHPVRGRLRPDGRVRRRLDHERRDRKLVPVRLPPRLELLRLPPPRGVAGRVLHVDERLQLGRDRVPRPAAVRVQPRCDARRQRRELHHHRGHRREHRAGLPAGRPGREHGSACGRARLLRRVAERRRVPRVPLPRRLGDARRTRRSRASPRRPQPASRSSARRPARASRSRTARASTGSATGSCSAPPTGTSATTSRS